MSNLRCPVTDQKDEILKSFQDITQTVSFDNTAIVWFVKKKKTEVIIVLKKKRFASFQMFRVSTLVK